MDFENVEQYGECYTDSGETIPHNVWDGSGVCATCGQRVSR